jgi:cytochrome P450
MTTSLTDVGLYTEGGHRDLWAWLRQNEPVRWEPLPSRPGEGFWAVTRYADVERVLRDSDTFTSEQGTLVNLLGKGDPAAGRQLAATDPPQHDRLRLPLNEALHTRAIGSLEPDVRAGVRRLLEPGLDGGPFDFAAAMRRLPMIAMTPLLGLPEGDTDELIRLVSMCNAEEDPDHQIGGDVQETLKHGHRELFAYFTDLIRDRRRRPTDDVIGLMLAARVDGEPFSVSSIISNCYSMLLGASGTLPHVPTAAVAHLAPIGGYRAWAADRDQLGNGIEEALRWATPASNFMRYTRRSVVMHGVSIPSGSPVVAYLGSANFDPDVFVDPERFDVARSPNRHLGFGVGRHYCVGSHLARFVLRILFQEMFASIDDVTVVEPVVRFQSTFLNGIKQLTVVASPTDRALRQAGA